MNRNVLVLNSFSPDVKRVKDALNPMGYLNFIEVNGPDHYRLLEPTLEGVLVIIMDILFPTENIGYVILEEIRGSDKFEKTPIIILTGANSISIMEKALSLGANDYVLTPFDPERLANAVRSLTKKTGRFVYEISKEPVIQMSPADYMARELRVAMRHGQPLSFIKICPVSFSPIISREEVITSDERKQACQQVYDIAEERLRSTDQAFLNDNGDILLVLPATDKEGAQKALDKITEEIRTQFEAKEQKYDEQFFGVCVTYPEDGKDLDELMNTAYLEVMNKERLEKMSALLNHKMAQGSMLYRRNKNQYHY